MRAAPATALMTRPRTASFLTQTNALGWTKRAQIVVSRDWPSAAFAKRSSDNVAVLARRGVPPIIRS